MAANEAKKYPVNLMDHLRSFEKEANKRKSNFELAKRWKFMYIEDIGAATGECPCGRKGIRYKCT